MHHQRQQRARLRAALTELPAVLQTAEMHKLMEERGYEQDRRTGKWTRVNPNREAVARQAGRGPSWAGILAKRKRKRRG